MKEIGYLYSLDNKKKEFPRLGNKFCKKLDKIKDFDFFKFLKFLVERVEKNKIEQNMAYKEIISINLDDLYNKTKIEQKHYQMIFYIFDKALQFKFLQKKQKAHLFKIKNEILKKNFKQNVSLFLF